MSAKGFQIRLFSALMILSIGTSTYASSSTQQLESINLSKEFIKTQAPKDFRRGQTIRLSALKTQKKKIKQKNLSKKFGPLLISFTVRSPRRTAVGFNIDVLETLDILAQKDPSLFLKTDGKHYILSPDTKEEVKRTLHLLKSKFNNIGLTHKPTSAQLI